MYPYRKRGNACISPCYKMTPNNSNNSVLSFNSDVISGCFLLSANGQSKLAVELENLFEIVGK